MSVEGTEKDKPSSSTETGALVNLEDLTGFTLNVLSKIIRTGYNVTQMTECLVAADYIGRPCRGLAKLPMYVEQLQKGVINGEAIPTIIKESNATAFVEGSNALGPVVGNFCIQLAMKKAETQGIGMVVVRGSNSLVLLSWYSAQAMKRGMLGLVFSNASATLCPTRAKKPAVGANPLSFAAQASGDDKFLLDMTLTTVSLGRIEKHHLLGQQLAHSDWVMDYDGRTTYDPVVAGKTVCFYPLGGKEATGGYKGYSMAVLVELLCSVLSGGPVGPHIPTWRKNRHIEKSLSQCFIVINPHFFAPAFDIRLSDLMDLLRGLEPANPALPVLIAGDKEANHMRKVDEDGGIYYHEATIANANEIASSLNVNHLIPKLIKY